VHLIIIISVSGLTVFVTVFVWNLLQRSRQLHQRGGRLRHVRGDGLGRLHRPEVGHDDLRVSLRLRGSHGQNTKVKILSLGLIHTWHFCTQYFDKKIFFSSNYCNAISKIFRIVPKKYFQYTQEKFFFGWKCIFIFLSQYLFISISRAKMSSV